MAEQNVKIKTIQFKRGLKASLEAKLTAEALGVPFAGEPIFEMDTGKLKIGDGKTAYIDLPYLQGTSVDENLPNFIIQDPLSNQVLLYDEETQSWVNKDLADKESIIYLAERGLTIKGYDEASQGYMLVKDQTKGLAWVRPLDSTQLNESVTAATEAMNQASAYSVQAGNAAVNAEKAEGNANRINQQTMTWVNEKFWWGSIEEYNQHISENGLNPGTFYFITPEK